MNYKRILFITLCTIGLAMGYYLSLQVERCPQEQTLRFGIVTGYAPFVSTNAQGDYEGFDIDVAQDVARAVARKPVFKDYGSMTSLLLALDQGSVDAIIWGLSITKDRLKKVTMIHYHGTDITSYPFIFWNKEIKKTITPQDLHGMTICVEPGSTQAAILERYAAKENFTLIPTERIDDALLSIQYGKADAAFVEPAIAHKFKTMYAEISSTEFPLTPEDYEQGIGIAIKKDNVLVKNLIQNGVKQLKINNALTKYEKKWGLA